MLCKVNLTQWEILTIETVPMNGEISRNFTLLQYSVAVFFSQAPIPRPAVVPYMENQGQVVAKCQLNLRSKCSCLYLSVNKTPVQQYIW